MERKNSSIYWWTCIWRKQHFFALIIILPFMAFNARLTLRILKDFFIYFKQYSCESFDTTMENDEYAIYKRQQGFPKDCDRYFNCEVVHSPFYVSKTFLLLSLLYGSTVFRLRVVRWLKTIQHMQAMREPDAGNPSPTGMSPPGSWVLDTIERLVFSWTWMSCLDLLDKIGFIWPTHIKNEREVKKMIKIRCNEN